MNKISLKKRNPSSVVFSELSTGNKISQKNSLSNIRAAADGEEGRKGAAAAAASSEGLKRRY